MSAPAVTVLVPSYNYERYLDAALSSVLIQRFTDFEVLVVEDGSTDHSLGLARAFARRDARVRVLTHADGGNHGLAASLALGLAAARGRYVAFLEADDLWLPTSLELRLEAAGRSRAGVVLNDVALLAMPGARPEWFESYVPRVMRWHRERAAAAARAAPGRAFPAYAPGAAFLLENKIPTFSCALVRTDLLRRVSLRAPVPRWLDWWVWAQIAALASFCFVPEKLTRWRLHADSWNSRVRPSGYLRDYRRMGAGLRRLFSGELLRAGRWAALGFLWLPACLRLAARLSLPLATDGPLAFARRVTARLDKTLPPPDCDPHR